MFFYADEDCSAESMPDGRSQRRGREAAETDTSATEYWVAVLKKSDKGQTKFFVIDSSAENN